MRLHCIGRRVFTAVFAGLVVCGPGLAALAQQPPKIIRLGMIGLDTSHVIAFTGVLNDPKATGVLAEVELVAGYPGGTDIPASADRVEKYTEQLRKKGIEIVDSIDELLKKVDAVLLESVDGRPHLEQVRPVFAAGKPVFIDKPFAGSLVDAIEICRLAKEHGVPFFSSSSLRFSSSLQAIRNKTSPFGDIRRCVAFSPCSLEPHHPDLYWYGVHGVEILYTIMGPGCKTVTRLKSGNEQEVLGVWADGREGIFQSKKSYGATVEGTKSSGSTGKYEGYKPLVIEIAKFFKTGKPPVSAKETLELFAFMEAADESKRQGGVPVTIESVMEKARKANQARRK